MSSEVHIDVELDHDGISRIPLTAEVRDDFRGRMERVEQIAKATGPVDTGEYVSKIHVVEEPDPDGTWHVDADADHSIYVELGTRQTDRNGRLIHPAHHTLGHALDAAGGDH